jgi:hypothetical protein
VSASGPRNERVRGRRYALPVADAGRDEAGCRRVRPVSVVTAARSGSTPLRYLLNHRSAITCPPNSTYRHCCNTPRWRQVDAASDDVAAGEDGASSAPEKCRQARRPVDKKMRGCTNTAWPLSTATNRLRRWTISPWLHGAIPTHQGRIPCQFQRCVPRSALRHMTFLKGERLTDSVRLQGLDDGRSLRVLRHGGRATLAGILGAAALTFGPVAVLTAPAAGVVGSSVAEDEHFLDPG